MKIYQIRNACTLIEVKEHRILVDPMLSEKGMVPGLGFSKGFKLVGKTDDLANPLKDLPGGADALIKSATCALVTHPHPDHLDKDGVKFLRDNKLKVYCSGHDEADLRGRGLDAHEVTDGDLGMRIEAVPAQHGYGPQAWIMGPGVGYYLAADGEPSLYITGDTVLTSDVRDAVKRLKPSIVVAPAGSANVGFGYDILFSQEELIELGKLVPDQIVYNHIEALDHCPTTRDGLLERLQKNGLADRSHVPADGDVLVFDEYANASYKDVEVKKVSMRPGVQKFVASLLG